MTYHPIFRAQKHLYLLKVNKEVCSFGIVKIEFQQRGSGELNRKRFCKELTIGFCSPKTNYHNETTRKCQKACKF